MADLMEVEVPVFGKMVVPAGTNPDDLMKALGSQYGVDVTKDVTPMQAFTRGMERGISGTTRGVGQVMTKVTGNERVAPGEDIQYDAMGNVISGGTAPSVQEQATNETVANADIRKELEYELAKLHGHTGASMGGYALGTVLDPANFIGGLGNSTVRSLIAEGVITGGVQGFFDPNYSDDTWTNRLESAALGATGGGVLSGLLGKGMKKLGWIEKDVGKTTDKAVGDVAGTAAEDVNKVMEKGTPAPTTETKAAEELTPNVAPEVKATENVSTSLDPAAYDASLPKELSKASPRYGRDVVSFESDLDRALYIVRDAAKRSAADSKFMNWIKEVTGIQDESIIRKLGDQVKTHVKDTKDLGVVPRSNLSFDVPVKAIEMPTTPFVGTSGKLDAGVNVNTNTWKSLDNVSQNLYNIGRKLLEHDATGVKPTISAAEQKQAYDIMKSINPDFKMNEMAEVFKGYAKAMDSLDKIRPAGWEAPSIHSILNNRISHEDFTDLFNAGFFDGCPI